jgi:hypothetical protein
VGSAASDASAKAASSPGDAGATDGGARVTRDAGIVTTDGTTCQAPRDLGSIAGDIEGGSITARGTCAGWLRVRMTEESSSVLANPMRVTATLVSPDGADFDLRLYVNKQTDAVECSEISVESTLPGANTDVASLEWGEEYTGNEDDDSRTVMIEVVATSAACASQPWTLLVQGGR